MVVCHKIGRPSPAGRGRKRVETGGFSASAIAAPVEPLTSDHRRRTILRGAGRREHPPLAKDGKLLGTNSDSDYEEDIDLNSDSDDDYMLEEMDKDDSDDESSEWKEESSTEATQTTGKLAQAIQSG